MPKQELAKAYNPADYEDRLYRDWEQSGFFNPDNLTGEPYAIMMPPPNVTGVLHLGHALENSLMDTMARYQRMKGKKVLLLPGTDHAAVATQAKVEKVLVERGIKNPRLDLGREKLLEKIREYAEASKATILKQIRKMGTSCDWSRLAYTFDEARSQAVNEIFIKMYHDGLIYRGKRIVNWDAKLQTTISDDEIVWQEEKVPFYYLQYGPFVIATARPETKFGDKYVVMHPADKRYKKYKHGDKFEAEWINGKVTATVIKDEAIDQNFGTGVMTITPWHDMTDFEIAERHNLNGEQIIDFQGKLLPIAGEFAGLEILEARPKIAEKLKAKGLVVKVEENYLHRVAKGDRSQGAVEPQIKEQWFVDVNKKIPSRNKSLKDLMREAVTIGHNGDRKQKVKITPDRFEKIYLNWINNLRDWCISRQIWWGHRIPVYYRRQETSKVNIQKSKFLDITYFVHGATRDNETGKSSGQHDPELSALGIKQAKELGKAIGGQKFDIIFTSDLKRAAATAELAFGKHKTSLVKDKRLRECDYGDLNGQAEIKFKEGRHYITQPHPQGESYQDVATRVNEFLKEVSAKYSGKKIAIMSHKIPQLALEVLINNKTWEQALEQDWRKKKAWQPGWRYKLNNREGNNQEIYVGSEAPEGEGWRQDEDTLDTWFSSGLWTFSTIGWPEKSKDLNVFHPTAWMQMGYEILFFWMARMILMSTYALDQIPFKDVYIHGILRNEQGKKFSKSSGNNIDPLEVIKKYGTDALRLSLISGIAPGNDARFYEEKVEGARNMVNKLWNVARYIITNYELGITNYKFKFKDLTLFDKWILFQMRNLIIAIEEDLDNYRFSQAVERLKTFTWEDLADWYLEASKFEKNPQKGQILNVMLNDLLKLWHPFIPFITETLWKEMNGRSLLLIEEYPAINNYLELFEKTRHGEFYPELLLIQKIISSIRNARAENKIEPSVKVKAVIYTKIKEFKKLIEEHTILIIGLRTGINELSVKIKGEKVEGAISVIVGKIEIYLLAEVDKDKEKARLEKEIANLEKITQATENKLANKEFVAKAPAAIVAKEKVKLEGWQNELKKLRDQLVCL